MIYQAIFASPLGDISIQSDGKHVTALYFVGQRYDGTLEQGASKSLEALPLWKTIETYLTRYFKGEKPDPQKIPLAPQGTAFQKRVWQKLLAIPYGEVTTYGAIAAEIAQETGKPHFSAQAVGNAVGRNPISIIIPCHRVIGKDGSLTGYAGGIERKKWLLEREGRRAAPDYLPEARIAPI